MRIYVDESSVLTNRLTLTRNKLNAEAFEAKITTDFSNGRLKTYETQHVADHWTVVNVVSGIGIFMAKLLDALLTELDEIVFQFVPLNNG